MAGGQIARGVKPRLDLSPLAISDLDAIWNYSVEHWGIARAKSYVSQINARMRTFCASPSIGQSVAKAYPGMRKSRIGSHLILYLVDRDRLTIVRVLHQRMDIDANITDD